MDDDYGEQGLWSSIKRSAAATSGTYEEMLAADTNLLWTIQDLCYRTPWLDRRMAKIVSKYPWQDICSIVWLFFIVGLFEFRSQHFFPVILNLGVSMMARRVIEAPRPVQIDIRLQPITDLSAESFGFPSIESYMSVVVLGNIIHLIQNWKLKMIFVPFAVFVVFLVGFSRIYSRSRFPHQIVGSWFLGFVGLVTGTALCNSHIAFHEMHWIDHLSYSFVAVICVVANFGLASENNDSRLLYVPKKEFVRVIGGIISGGNNQDQADVSQVGGGAGAGGRSANRPDAGIQVAETPRSTAVRRLMELAADKMRKGVSEKEVKHDSFYYLQLTLERREEEVRRAKLKLLGDGKSVQSLINENLQVNYNYSNGSRSIFQDASSPTTPRGSRRRRAAGAPESPTTAAYQGLQGKRGRRKAKLKEPKTGYFSESITHIPVATEIFFDADNQLHQA